MAEAAETKDLEDVVQPLLSLFEQLPAIATFATASEHAIQRDAAFFDRIQRLDTAHANGILEACKSYRAPRRGWSLSSAASADVDEVALPDAAVFNAFVDETEQAAIVKLQAMKEFAVSAVGVTKQQQVETAQQSARAAKLKKHLVDVQKQLARMQLEETKFKAKIQEMAEDEALTSAAYVPVSRSHAHLMVTAPAIPVPVEVALADSNESLVDKVDKVDRANPPGPPSATSAASSAPQVRTPARKPPGSPKAAGRGAAHLKPPGRGLAPGSMTPPQMRKLARVSAA